MHIHLYIKHYQMLNRFFAALFVFSMGLSLPIALSGQASGNHFATLVNLEHACGATGAGYVEFELNGNPDFLTYYWEHGPTDLALDDLPPGVYTFIVKDFFGCKEEYEIEILAISNCQLQYEITDARLCSKQISITVLSGGVPLPEESLEVIWDDGAPSGLTRIVSTSTYGQYHVTIHVMSGEDICCTVDQWFYIPADPKCIYKGSQVIVNEFNRDEDGNRQYVELLIAGNGTCGDTFDLRGYHLDDNNGLLIPGNEFLSLYNLENVGINPGFFTFTQNPAWAEVPTGSLIVIYSERGIKHEGIPADDPTDSNQDGVYVLAGNASDYLTASEGIWNETEQEMDYGGNSDFLIWEKIEISSPADGMQVREPDGDYVHGVSLGASSFNGQDTFDLWITNLNSTSSTCRFILNDPFVKEDFECTPSEDSLQSPGLANSVENLALINLLRFCDDSIQTLSQGNAETRTQKAAIIPSLPEEFRVFPNPFYDAFNLQIQSSLPGEAKLILYSTAGSKLRERTISCEAGRNQFQFNSQGTLPSGLLIFQLTFPSGEVRNVRITRIE
jgi:hypothetical protein